MQADGRSQRHCASESYCSTMAPCILSLPPDMRREVSSFLLSGSLARLRATCHAARAAVYWESPWWNVQVRLLVERRESEAPPGDEEAVALVDSILAALTEFVGSSFDRRLLGWYRKSRYEQAARFLLRCGRNDLVFVGRIESLCWEDVFTSSSSKCAGEDVAGGDRPVLRCQHYVVDAPFRTIRLSVDVVHLHPQLMSAPGFAWFVPRDRVTALVRTAQSCLHRARRAGVVVECPCLQGQLCLRDTSRSEWEEDVSNCLHYEEHGRAGELNYAWPQEQATLVEDIKARAMENLRVRWQCASLAGDIDCQLARRLIDFESEIRKRDDVKIGVRKWSDEYSGYTSAPPHARRGPCRRYVRGGRRSTIPRDADTSDGNSETSGSDGDE